MYTTLSRVSIYDKRFCVGRFEPSSIKVSFSALQEYERLEILKRYEFYWILGHSQNMHVALKMILTSNE